jgi:hypothetical protein
MTLSAAIGPAEVSAWKRAPEALRRRCVTATPLRTGAAMKSA